MDVEKNKNENSFFNLMYVIEFTLSEKSRFGKKEPMTIGLNRIYFIFHKKNKHLLFF